MSSKRYAHIRGRRATDDLLSAEVSSPAGEAIFDCPDCGEKLPIRSGGELTCVRCGSIFLVHSHASQHLRDRFLIRRKPVD